MIDHYADMHRREDILAYRDASRRMLRALGWAFVGALAMIAVLHDAPVKIAATVWQAQNEQH